MDTLDDNPCFNKFCTQKGLKVCTGCKHAWYCSKECQEDHWWRHKKFCKIFRSSTEMSLRYYKACHSLLLSRPRRESGELDQALSTLQESLETFKEFHHDVHTSMVYYELGQVLNRKRQYEEALVNFRKALEMTREIFGENYYLTCNCYEYIGNILGEQGRYDDALIGYGKALEIRLKIFGENHIDTGRSYYNIGAVSQLNKGDYDGALTSLQKAKAIFTRELGEEHPHTVLANVNIDFCEKCMDQTNKAVPL